MVEGTAVPHPPGASQGPVAIGILALPHFLQSSSPQPLILQVEAGNRGPREDRTCRGMRWNPPALLPPPLSLTTCHLPITPQPFTPGQDPGCPVAHPAPKPQTPSLSSKSSVLAKESSQPEVAPSGRQHLSSSLSSLLSENFLHPVPVLSPAVPPQHKGDGPPGVRGSVL